MGLAAVQTRRDARPVELESVYREHQGRVFRAAYRVTGSAADAEDVLQTVFLRLAQGGPDRVDNPASYLYRAAVNSALDLLRARKDRPSVPLEAAGDLPDAGRRGPHEEREVAEVKDWLRRALATLPPKAAEMFALRYLEDMDNRDIARLLGCSRLAVAVTLHRTRQRLQNEFRVWRGGRS